jgi:hypothetical protein
VRKLSDLLLAERVLSPAQLERALEAQSVQGGGLDTCILELGLCDQAALERVIAHAAATPNSVDPSHGAPAVDALGLLRSPDAARWRVVPWAMSGRTVDVVSAYPPDLRVIDEVAFKLGKDLRVSLTAEVRVAQLLEDYYGVPMAPRLAHLVHPIAAEDEPEAPPAPTLDPMAFDPSLRELPRLTSKPPRTAVVDGHPPPKVPEYTPIEYTPEKFDPALADFRDADQPSGVRTIHRKLTEVIDRDQLPPLLFGLLSTQVRRAALFSVARGMCTGWDASGIDPQRIRTMTFPLAERSIFQEASEGDVYVGRMLVSDINEDLARRFGEPQLEQVIVVPIKIRGKVVTILVCDCESERALEKAFTDVIDIADKLARTLVRIILERKKAT